MIYAFSIYVECQIKFDDYLHSISLIHKNIGMFIY